MGCWNETCAISHMSINAGEKIKIIFIAQEGYTQEIAPEIGDDSILVDKIDSGCYLNDYWSPVGIPVSCEYDDYGRGTKFSNESECEFTLKTLREMHIPIKVGENDYHDLPTEGIKDIESAVMLAIESRLYYKMSYQGTIRPIKMIMVKQSVWDAMLTMKLHSWMHRNKVTIEHVKKATELILNEEYIKHEASIKKIKDRMDQDKTKDMELEMLGMMRKHKFYDRKDMVHSLANSVKICGGSALDTFGLYADRELSAEMFAKLKDQMAEFSFINMLMVHLRINYAPTTGTGSQDDNSDMYPSLFKKFSEISEKDSHRYDELGEAE